MEVIIRKQKVCKALNSHPQKEMLIKLVKGFQQLEESGYSKDKINEVIQKLELPLTLHLWFTANYSDLISLKFK